MAELGIKNIVSPESDSNATIDQAIKLIDVSPTSANAIKAKQIGLQLTLLGLAEIQALRIRNLAVAAYKLEQKLYSAEKLEQLDPRKLLQTYEALNIALNEAITYVKGVDTNSWKDLETHLITLIADSGQKSGMTEEELAEQREVSNVAKDMLMRVSSGKVGDHAQ